ncbi:hypothetical protein [Sphingomonas hankookensis]|uniref:hypothetical protein n=1 Tax=Sphingomonas hankookensis TaxID=563996 RepID=UPI003D3017D9
MPLAAMPAAAQEVAPRETTAQAEVEAAPENDGGADIIVTGYRAALGSAQEIKRNSPSIVDAIVSNDIGKLPDNNAAEAIARVTGVTVRRSGGQLSCADRRASRQGGPPRRLVSRPGRTGRPVPAAGPVTLPPGAEVSPALSMPPSPMQVASHRPGGSPPGGVIRDVG